MSTSKKRRRASRLAPRTRRVWAAFGGSMTILVRLFALSERMPTGGFLVAARAEAIDGAETDPLFALEVPVDRERWSGIVIHDSGRPAGDPNSLHREHLALAVPHAKRLTSGRPALQSP